MKRTVATAAMFAAVLLAGCANTRIGYQTGGAPALGSSYSSAAVNAEFNSNRYFSLLFIGVLAAGIEETYANQRPGPDWRNPPQLAADRAVAERDCSQPLVVPSANLRCK